MPINPTLSRKDEAVFTLNENVKKLFQVIYRENNKEEAEDDIPKIKVSELISRLAFYYEKIRNSVDYKEEYLLRRSSILRILKRQIIIEGPLKMLKPEDIAKNLLVELIRAGYLANNKLPETKIGELAVVIDKYLQLRQYSLSKIADKKQNHEINKWILALASAEIEERLNINPVQQITIGNMYGLLSGHIALPKDSIYQPDREIQIYLSIHRIFMKFDDDMLEFLLLKYYNANWLNAADAEIKNLANSIEAVREAIAEQMNHPLAAQINKVINRYSVYYTILNDVIMDNPVGVYEGLKDDPKAFPRLIKKFAQKRYHESKVKLRRAAVRSIIYIFLTKMILAFILEIPVTFWLGEVLNYTSLAINIAFPPLLLFLIVLFTRTPSEANSFKIINGVEEIMFKEKAKKEPIILKQPIKRARGINGVFAMIYAITFLITFGLVIYGLDKIHFTFVSIVIFLFFLTLVSFFSLRIRKVAREMYIVERRDNIFSFITDFFYVPIIEVGKWLNEKFSRLNFFVFILDFIIEAPFKVLVDIAEEWTKYVKERKEEIM
ncbi:MAG: hypothetical protein UU95_C0035G0008 [Parcubacteria group bacterium GW2011_GWC2_42_12]|nr:MAG: hypothetical protein UU95_C0035G0008 [Parcubacteria group bacterium GW2011_GWC2_42_12]